MRLVKLRGESMQAAADAQPSGMVSVIGLSSDKVRGGGAGGWVAGAGKEPGGCTSVRAAGGPARMRRPPQPAGGEPRCAPTAHPPQNTPAQVAELCEAASAEVPAGQGVRIANYLCNGNYAVSGGLAGCEAVERLAKGFKARWVQGRWAAG